MFQDIKTVRDLPTDAFEQNLECRIFGGVWGAVDQALSDGGVALQYRGGRPDDHHVEVRFRMFLSIAAGLFTLPADFEIDEVRVIDRGRRYDYRLRPIFVTEEQLLGLEELDEFVLSQLREDYPNE